MLGSVKKLTQSFKYALSGIAQCVRYERNFRIHLTACVYVLFFAYGARATSEQFCILFLCFALMLGSEQVNTAIERLCDKNSSSYNSIIKSAKDIAAGAVLTSALFSIGVGMLLFFNVKTLVNISLFLDTNLWLLPVLVLSVPLALVFVFKKQ